MPSTTDESVKKAYGLETNSYLVKPQRFQVLVQTWQQFYRFRIEHAPLPIHPHQSN